MQLSSRWRQRGTKQRPPLSSGLMTSSGLIQEVEKHQQSFQVQAGAKCQCSVAASIPDMSLFGKIFGGGGKGGKGPSPQEAIQKLRETEEMLTKKQEFLEKKIEQELQIAKKNGTKNKRAALQALKRKKRYEKQLAQIDGTLSTIEFQREALENANTNTEVLKNMGFAAKAMKSAHENMDIDKVDDLMQDITEQQELAQEISDAISKPVGFGEEFDEDELLAELDELEQEELDKNLLEIGGPENVPLPNVPSTSLPSRPAKKEEDEDDMEDLQRWAMEAM
ncbi:charged multivesicular body protein 4b [Lates japonicus]|nr:charged multivesicular body protein 4b [Lates japonicus]